MSSIVSQLANNVNIPAPLGSTGHPGRPAGVRGLLGGPRLSGRHLSL